MTLTEAVRILNERKHREHDQWAAGDCEAIGPELDINDPLCLTEFEAIAIGEKYQRDALDEMARIGQEINALPNASTEGRPS